MRDLVNELNSRKIIQVGIDWEENIPENVWEEVFENNYDPVKEGLDVDKHRWYELCTSVFSLNGKLIGVRHVWDLFSESMTVEDVYHTLEFFEMEAVEVKTVKYKKLVGQ
jgi:hypothetical protein